VGAITLATFDSVFNVISADGQVLLQGIHQASTADPNISGGSSDPIRRISLISACPQRKCAFFQLSLNEPKQNEI
jgi:hypothetical protein